MKEIEKKIRYFLRNKGCEEILVNSTIFEESFTFTLDFRLSITPFDFNGDRVTDIVCDVYVEKNFCKITVTRIDNGFRVTYRHPTKELISAISFIFFNSFPKK